ncbi:MAG TPA: transposase [Anaerolineaceae bacterium]|nr:transposase [Anaerolineaceae bacterium]HPN53873.1 transposase [Anaerolineaceae bacterium]
MIKSFKYRLYPTSPQERQLEHMLEVCRHWYNLCLEERKTAWEESGVSIGKFFQLSRVKEYKQFYGVGLHSHMLQVVVQDLDKAFQNFFRRVKAGETPGYPRFKGADRFDSIGLKEYGNGFKIDGRRLHVTGIGRIRVRWHREIEGQIKTVRLRKQAGEWFACFSCDVPDSPSPVPTDMEVGIDVGIHHLAATSDGEVIENPKWYRGAQKKLRVAQRRVSRRTKGGSNRRKAIVQLQKQHEHVKNCREDYLNKLAYWLIQHYDRIAIEDLTIKGMVRNHHLSKSIMDAGWGYLKQRLMSKAEEAGRQVILVNPAFTSKTCSNCGQEIQGLTLADRWVTCPCGLSEDRDVNAAKNILARANQKASHTAGSAVCGVSTEDALWLPQEASQIYL